ncbi:MAG: hypothetical protein E7652_06730 [Ruminococcaceae bacterium]|nr:hypothetical protein [Oscillospiraceae bacterium]
MKREYRFDKQLNNEQLDALYNRLYSIYKTAQSEDVLKEIGTLFASIPDYKDSSKLAVSCFKKAEEIHNDNIYFDALALVEKGDTASLRRAAFEFERIREWRDSASKIEECNERIAERRSRHDSEIYRKHYKTNYRAGYRKEQMGSETLKMVLIGASVGVIILILQWLWNIFII